VLVEPGFGPAATPGTGVAAVAGFAGAVAGAPAGRGGSEILIVSLRRSAGGFGATPGVGAEVEDGTVGTLGTPGTPGGFGACGIPGAPGGFGIEGGAKRIVSFFNPDGTFAGVGGLGAVGNVNPGGLGVVGGGGTPGGLGGGGIDGAPGGLGGVGGNGAP